MLSKKSQWNSRVIRRPGRPTIDWLCLGALGDPTITLGVLRDGKWVVDTADGLADLEDIRALTFAFPLLKLPYSEVRGVLLQFQKNFADVDFAEFPINRLVVYAISNGGGYWAEQSLKWLPDVDLVGDEKVAVADGLRAIEDDKGLEQKLRHSAARYRRKLESQDDQVPSENDLWL